MIYKYSKIPHNQPLWERADVGKKVQIVRRARKPFLKTVQHY